MRLRNPMSYGRDAFLCQQVFLLRNMYSIVLYCVRVGADDVFGLVRRREKRSESGLDWQARGLNNHKGRKANGKRR